MLSPSTHQPKLKLMASTLLLALSLPATAEITTLVEQKVAFDSKGHSQKWDTLIRPEFNTELTDNTSMTLIGRLRYSQVDNLGPFEDKPVNYASINGPLVAGRDGAISIREWYIDSEFAGGFWRLGKQQVVWGQADGLKILDVVNPQSYREFILDDFDASRIPLWMVNVEFPIGEDDSLQILWIPDTSYHEFAAAGTTFEITSPLSVPRAPAGVSVSGFNERKPSSMLGDSDVGLRYASFYQGWDLTFNYLYHYQDTPVLYQQLDLSDINNISVGLDSIYERNHLIGATASNVFGDTTFRAEVGYSSDTFNLIDSATPLAIAHNGIWQSAEISSVVALDWQGLEDTMISVQYFQSYLVDYDHSVIRPQQNNIFSLLYKQSFENEVWELEVLALHGLDQDDGSIQSKLSYMLQSDIKLSVGSDVFYGGQQGLFGQFKDKDRLTFNLEWGF